MPAGRLRSVHSNMSKAVNRRRHGARVGSGGEDARRNISFDKTAAIVGSPPDHVSHEKENQEGSTSRPSAVGMRPGVTSRSKTSVHAVTVLVQRAEGVMLVTRLAVGAIPAFASLATAGSNDKVSCSGRGSGLRVGAPGARQPPSSYPPGFPGDASGTPLPISSLVKAAAAAPAGAAGPTLRMHGPSHAHTSMTPSRTRDGPVSDLGRVALAIGSLDHTTPENGRGCTEDQRGSDGSKVVASPIVLLDASG